MSASPTINGIAGAYEQPQRYGWAESGPYTIRTWHGTKTAIEAQYAVCVAAGAVSEVREGYGVHILEARYATTDDNPGSIDNVVDTWEFFANSVEKDIMESTISTVTALTDTERRTIALWNDPDTAPASLTSDGQDIFNLRMKGVRSIRIFQPVLRHTKTVSDSYTIKAGLTNVGKILTTAQLQSQETLPVDILFNLPNDANPSTDPVLIYGWYKYHPTVRIAAFQKIQIEQEWEYGLWPVPTLYAAAT